MFGHDASAEVQSVVAGAGAELKIDQKPLQDITDTRPINYPPCLFLNDTLRVARITSLGVFKGWDFLVFRVGQEGTDKVCVCVGGAGRQRKPAILNGLPSPMLRNPNEDQHVRRVTCVDR